MRMNITQPSDPYVLWSQQGFAFGGSVNVAAVAAQNSIAQLFNPIGSAREVHVKEIWASLATAGDILISSDTVAATTDGGAWASLLAGFVAGQSHLRQKTNAGNVGTTIWRFSLPAATATRIALPVGIVLTPGKGVDVQAVTVNIGLIANFAGLEFAG